MSTVRGSLKTSPGIKVKIEKPLDEMEPKQVLKLGEIPDFEIFKRTFRPTFIDFL